MKNFKSITKQKYQMMTREYLNRLYGIGLSQMDIAIYLNVTDRAIRKWERFDSVPSGIQYCNLFKLCKEFGA